MHLTTCAIYTDFSLLTIKVKMKKKKKLKMGECHLQPSCSCVIPHIVVMVLQKSLKCSGVIDGRGAASAQSLCQSEV